MKIIYDGVYLFSSRALNAGSQLVLVIAVSRYLRPENFGLYSFLSSLVLLGFPLANFGLDTWMVREISRKNDSFVYCIGNILSLKILMALVVMSCFFVFMPLISTGHMALYLFSIYSLSILFHAPAEALWHAGDGMGNFKIHSFLWSATNFLKMAFGVSAVLLFGAVEPLLWGLVTAEAVALMISWVVVYGILGPFGLTGDIRVWAEIIKKVAPIALAGFLSVFYFRLDTIMLAVMKDNTEVGYYNAAYRVFEIFSVLPSTLLIVLFPRLSKNYGVGKDAFERHLFLGFFFMAASGIILTLLLNIFSSWITHVCYGETYWRSVGSLRILSWAIPFYFVNFFAGYVLISMGKEKLNLVFLLLAIFCNFGLNGVLIPPYGHEGAAKATLYSEMLLFLFYLLVERRNARIIRRNGEKGERGRWLYVFPFLLILPFS